MPSILWLPVVFCISTTLLYYLAVNMPDLDKSINSTNVTQVPSGIRFPASISDLQVISSNLNLYTSTNPSYVIVLFCAAYIYKQTFAIPGSVFMNILAGSLFGIWRGFPLTCLLTSVGATNCYLLSHFFGKSFVMSRFSSRVEPLQRMIDQDTGSLFLFLLSLRLFPMAPNWFMNITAPVLNVPVYLFFPSVFIGLMPYNFLCVQAGCVLTELTSANSIFTAETLAKMMVAAAAALVPSLILRSYKSRSNAVAEVDSNTR